MESNPIRIETRTTPAAPPVLTVDALVDATPASRDRYVDLLRALSIAVVVLWHWVFSITQWSRHDALTMPNPIDSLPGAWLTTWVLQIMPVFFLVGGYANLAGWESSERKGGGSQAFLAGRLRRLARPVGIYVGCWAVADLALRLAWGADASVLRWGMVVFVPLWFLGVYVGVIVLAPLTIAAHRRFGLLVPVTLGGAILASDRLRFEHGVGAAGVATSVLVWLFVHQLGYFWRDGSLAATGRRGATLLAAGGLATLVTLTAVGPYPRSMVSTSDSEISNMYPTTAPIAALAAFQLGLVLLAAPAMRRWLERRRVWRVVVSVNAVAMTIFCWHMTALIGAIAVFEAAGGRLGTEADTGWWLQRPLWLAAPGVLLAGLVAVFARFELPGRPVRTPRSRMT